MILSRDALLARTQAGMDATLERNSGTQGSDTGTPARMRYGKDSRIAVMEGIA